MTILKRTALLAGAAFLASATPAAAATFVIGSTEAPFSFAQYNGGTSFDAFTLGCAARPDLGSTCMEGPGGAGASHVVFNPAGGVLVAHPGPSLANNTTVLFTAPRSSVYTFDVNAFLADPNLAGNGVTLAGYFLGNSVGGLTLTPGINETASFAGGIFLNAGQQVGLIIGNNGSNSFDSLGLTGSVSGVVPEPSTWAMMILGIGMIGAGLRRRARQALRLA